MDTFTEGETIIGYVDTDSGGVLIADMTWDVPKNTQKRVALDLDMENTRIPVKAVLVDGRRRLILELDEAVNTLQVKETVDVIDDDKAEE
jgi:hypothetical protein